MKGTKSQIVFLTLYIQIIMMITQSIPQYRLPTLHRKIHSLGNLKELSIKQDEYNMKTTQLSQLNRPKSGKFTPINNNRYPFIIKKSFTSDFNNYTTIKPTFYQYVKSCCNREVMRPMGGGHMTGPCCKQLIKFNHFIRLSFPWFQKTLTKLTTD
ncbi:hypothetical protein EWB00_006427 [Schistosoma japonicum]|uniref:Uncharacterized protein n=1 Tax=Schistosoma japonicum TaxID=6182 RepID=A0A4Z2CYB3_SCHJA|nr:hypothetical protein EWB00_006427 [Schistosoma japonicum]